MPPRVKNPNAPAPDDTGWVHYVEPYAGGLAVLLAQDPKGISEVANDINFSLTNFWRVLQCDGEFERFCRRMNAVPFSEAEWLRSEKPLRLDDGPDVGCAVAFFIRVRQSLSGRMKDFASLTRNRARRKMNEQASAWLSAIEGLSEVHERLKRVVILNHDALKVIQQQDGKRTLFYLDPPYLHETRATTGEYEHEMTWEDHNKLLAVLGKIEGRFLLSGYHSNLYDEAAKHYGWKCHEFEIPNHASGGKEKRRMVECVWCNY